MLAPAVSGCQAAFSYLATAVFSTLIDDDLDKFCSGFVSSCGRYTDIDPQELQLRKPPSSPTTGAKNRWALIVHEELLTTSNDMAISARRIVLALLTCLLVCTTQAVLVNRTIDYTYSDNITGQLPIYQPNGAWNGVNCSCCLYNPDKS